MILKELTVATGKYTDQQGNEKTRWRTIGHLHEGKNGQYITLDSITNLAALPRKEGDDRVYVNMFDPKPREGRATASEPRKAPAAEAGGGFRDDDIPFASRSWKEG